MRRSVASKKRAAPPSVDDQLDQLLGDIVNQGWEEPGVATSEPESPPEPAPGLAAQVACSEPEYPPLPVREPDPYAYPVVSSASEVGERSAGDDDEDERAVPAQRAVMDVGLLADLAAGRKTAVQAAQFAGVTVDQVQSSLALALREVPPEEIAKAMGLQAAEQQLKSGAIYGVILADLMADMAQGRLKPDVKIELAKLLARVGRIEPKEDKGAGAGSGFILNINLGAGREPVTIDAG